MRLTIHVRVVWVDGFGKMSCVFFALMGSPTRHNVRPSRRRDRIAPLVDERGPQLTSSSLAEKNRLHHGTIAIEYP